MNVLVTGGGTAAPIDDVRTITNLSTGRFSASISESHLARGDHVWHLHAPTAALPLLRFARFDMDAPDTAGELVRLGRLRERWLECGDRLRRWPLHEGTVAEYAEALRAILATQRIDVAYLAMAVSDYEPIAAPGKLSSSEDRLVIECRRTMKVIRQVRDWAPPIYLVGFKLLSRVSEESLITAAAAAGRANRADLTVANDLQSVLEGRHTVHLVREGVPTETLGPGHDLADRLVDRVRRWAGTRQDENGLSDRREALR